MEGKNSETSAIKVQGKGFYCELCSRKLATDQCVRDHIKGRKHQRIVGLKSTREEQSEKSIFVGGLCRLVSELELTDYFSDFGPVSQVIIDKDKAKYAIVEFTSASTAVKASQNEKQLMNGKKIVVRPRENKQFVPRSRNNKKNGNGSGGINAEDLKLLKVLSQLKDHETQIQTLVTATALTAESVKLRYLICNLLQEVFCEFSPYCHVYPYGSSVNGFGKEKCDLDIYLNLSEMGDKFTYQFAKLQGEETPEKVKETNMDTKEAMSTLKDFEIDDTKSEQALQFVAEVLRKFVPSCQNIRVIPSARKPLVKFIHKDSGLHCDIVLNNRLSLRNTELLYLYSLLSPFLRPLAFTIRQWAKCYQLAGNVGAGPKLTNYALTWLVVFFLQSKGILPSVESLKELDDSGAVETVDGWNCSFQKNLEKIPKRKTEASLDSLLREFFEYFSKLDFTALVISSSKGEVIPVGKFSEDPQHKDFKRGPVNIQDPFELAHNVAMNVNEKVALSFKQECKRASFTCLTTNYKKCPSNTIEGAQLPLWGIALLFQPQEPVENKKDKYSEGYTILLSLKSQQLSSDFVSQHKSAVGLRRSWQRKARDLVIRIFRDVLNVRCSDSEDCQRNHPDSWQEEDETSENGEKVQTRNEDMMVREMPLPTEEVSFSHCEGREQECGTTNERNAEKYEGSMEVSESSEDLKRTKEGMHKRSLEEDEKEVDNKRIKMDNMAETEDNSCEDLDLSCANMTPESGKSSNINSGVSSTLMCEISHHVWLGRRKVRRQLHQSETCDDGLELERKVTQKIIEVEQSEGSTSSKLPRILCRFKLYFDIDDSEGLIVKMVNQEGETDFKNFFHFLENYLPKIVYQQKV